MTAFGNQITEACKCRESVFAHWRLTWGSLVDRLYQIIEAHALGSWLTLEIITTGKELVWREKRTQSVNAAEENDNALLGFVFFLSFSCQPKHCSLAWLFLRSGAGPAVGNVCLACLRWDVGFQKVVSTQAGPGQQAQLTAAWSYTEEWLRGFVQPEKGFLAVVITRIGFEGPF